MTTCHVDGCRGVCEGEIVNFYKSSKKWSDKVDFVPGSENLRNRFVCSRHFPSWVPQAMRNKPVPTLHVRKGDPMPPYIPPAEEASPEEIEQKEPLKVIACISY